MNKFERQNLYKKLLDEKNALENEISKITGEFIGKKDSAIAKKVDELELKKSRIENEIAQTENQLNALKIELENVNKKIGELSRDGRAKILEAIKKQRWFFFKNPKEILFDTYTGYMWPNLDYHKITKNDGRYSYSEAKKILMNIKYGNYENWKLPSADEFVMMIKDKKFPFKEGENYRIQKVDYFIEINTRIDLDDLGIKSSGTGAFLPCNDKFASGDFLPKNKTFSPNEKAEKVLEIFLQEKWESRFDDENINELYVKFFKTLPELKKRHKEISSKLRELEKLNYAILDGFNFEGEFSKYDLEKVNRSLISYNNAVINWLNNILEKIANFKEAEKDLLAVAVELNDKLDDISRNYDNYEIIKKRNLFLEKNLDYNIETVENEINKLRDEALALKQELEETTDLRKLAKIEKRNYPSFNLVAEQTAAILNKRIIRIEWFKNHKEITEKIIGIHAEWCENYDMFLTSNKISFFKKGRGELIDEAKLQVWFEKWKAERDALEERLLFLLEAAFNGKIDFSLLEKIIEKVAEYRENLKEFYLTKRVPIYIKNAEKNDADFFDQINYEKEFYAVSENFQKDIENLIFRTENTMERMLIAKWAENWINDRIGELIALTKKESFSEELIKLMLKEIQALQHKNFTDLIISKEKYAERRENDYNKMQSITRKMLKALEN